MLKKIVMFSFVEMKTRMFHSIRPEINWIQSPKNIFCCLFLHKLALNWTFVLFLESVGISVL